ncbi:hypothetical protein HIM_12474 [Hirsutella minnesotensis 3608]|uniref:Uncharacterized protein n=1 Tax=Hirsutella minnesotensis 3608 TaxID=1043627 RepID=A0A0F7ZQM7_9HYPO|nr:hypothetical protein HIM_12474 [Hirsutella minnesotensis 3608]
MYSYRWKKYEVDRKDYEKQEENIQRLREWVTTHISYTYYRTCCSSESSLKCWYTNLKDTAQGSREEVIRKLKSRYRDIVRPSNRPQKSWTEWLKRWDEIISEGKQENLMEALNRETWLGDFIEAIRPHFDSWVNSFELSETYKNHNLTPKELVGIFSRFLDGQQSRGKIKPGAFGPTFNNEENQGSRASKKRSRPPAETRDGKKLCRLCENTGHTIEECYSLLHADSFIPKERTKANVEKNLKNKDIAQEVERLRGKKAAKIKDNAQD